MTKREVCELLGKSKRTVENYIREGLPVAYVKGQNGNTAVFRRSEVEAFQRQREEAWKKEEPWRKAKPVPGGPEPAALAAVNGRGHGDPFAGLAAHLAKLAAAFPSPPPTVGKWLTLDEAAEASGLPKTYLLAQARAGAAWAINAGSEKRAAWRFRTDGIK